MNAYLILENGNFFQGHWLGGKDRAGEIVFNTSTNGYEEIATDPSYFGQIMVMCAPQQGNYGVDKAFWESKKIWIQGFICLEMQNSPDNKAWVERLEEFDIPMMDSVDTRKLVLFLRENGTQVGALVQAKNLEEAKEKAGPLISAHKEMDLDWAYKVSRTKVETLVGQNPEGPKVAILDYGCKENIIREMQKRSKEIILFPSRATSKEILNYNPDGVLLSNGPGDPAHVEETVPVVQELIGMKPIFGICMGHQILVRALDGKTFPLKFGHRGANHPVKNLLDGKICVTSQNHGYAIDPESLPSGVEVTHRNLNDQTVSGIQYKDKNCFSVQFHPESHPGPRDAENIFDQFVDWMNG